MSNLGVGDLVAFARDLTGLDIPRIQDVISITFNYLAIYICTGGVWVGSKYYPPGFAFSADMILWNNDVNIMCCELVPLYRFLGLHNFLAVSSSQITIHGGTKSFHVGILWIHGANGRSEATLDCSIGASLAYVKVNGAVTVWYWWFGWHSREVAADVYVKLYPSLDVSGNMYVISLRLSCCILHITSLDQYLPLWLHDSRSN